MHKLNKTGIGTLARYTDTVKSITQEPFASFVKFSNNCSIDSISLLHHSFLLPETQITAKRNKRAQILTNLG